MVAEIHAGRYPFDNFCGKIPDFARNYNKKTVTDDLSATVYHKILRICSG